MRSSLLTQQLNITNHPISLRHVADRQVYNDGLAEFMCAISKGDSIARLLTMEWCKSINHYQTGINWRVTPDLSSSRGVIGLKYRGFRFFRMDKEFIFDCLYLTQRFDPKLVEKAYELLRDKVFRSNRNSKLVKMKQAFDYGIDPDVAMSLVMHRRRYMNSHSINYKKVLVVATMSAGKSTLVNALIGYKLNEIGNMACTDKVVKLYNMPNVEGLIVHKDDDSYMHTFDKLSVKSSQFKSAALQFKSSLASERICLIDTPGDNNSIDSKDAEITRKAILSNDYNALLFVSDSRYFAVNDEIELLDFVIEHTQKPIILVINQLDRFNSEEDSIEEIMTAATEIMQQRKRNVPIVPLSAYAAMLSNIDRRSLTNDEREDLNRLAKRMKKSYYDLPSYFCDKRYKGCQDIYSRSGMTILENIIRNI